MLGWAESPTPNQPGASVADAVQNVTITIAQDNRTTGMSRAPEGGHRGTLWASASPLRVDVDIRERRETAETISLTLQA